MNNFLLPPPSEPVSLLHLIRPGVVGPRRSLHVLCGVPPVPLGAVRLYRSGADQWSTVTEGLSSLIPHVERCRLRLGPPLQSSSERCLTGRPSVRRSGGSFPLDPLKVIFYPHRVVSVSVPRNSVDEYSERPSDTRTNVK